MNHEPHCLNLSDRLSGPCLTSRQEENWTNPGQDKTPNPHPPSPLLHALSQTFSWIVWSKGPGLIGEPRGIFACQEEVGEDHFYIPGPASSEPCC